MLTLTRKQGEVVWIGETQICIAKLNSRRVSLAIDAPPEVRIERDEIRRKPVSDGTCQGEQA